MAPPPPQPRLTHFLSLPLDPLPATLDPALTTLATHLPPHIPPGAIRPAITLHLTLGVLSLPTPADLTAATTLLSTLPLPAAPPPRIRLRGLAAMGPPTRTSVLYAVPEDASGDLRRLAEAVRAAFLAAGLVRAERRALRLHATLVNTVYVSRRGSGGGMVFDAREALAWGRDVVFADGVVVGRVCLCRMGEVWARGVCEGYLEVGTRVLVQEVQEEVEEEEGGVVVV